MGRRFDPGLGVLVPVILGGVAALSVLCAPALSRFFPPLFPVGSPMGAAFLSGLSVAGVSAIFVILALRPIRRLLATTPPVLPKPALSVDRGLGEFNQLGVVADRMVEVLGKLDARALFPDMVGESRVMRGVFAQILKVAATDATVLLLGASGSGKDLAARGIHEKSSQCNGPFIAVNCAAIPQGLLESELFGHEKGAFTGAVSRQLGKFEQASGGTLFLDEIGDMPLETQAKILRTLETRRVVRLGGSREVPVDARIVAATHRDLPAMIRQGLFREDLFHRIHVFPLQLPSLRERREDIPLLAERFLEARCPGAVLSVEALQHLLAYDWPGNVRELKNTIERAAVLCAGESTIRPEHLPGLGGMALLQAGEMVENGAMGDLDGRMAAYEKLLIEAALMRTGGVQARAAVLLGIKERSLWHRVKKHGINAGVFKDGPGRAD